MVNTNSSFKIQFKHPFSIKACLSTPSILPHPKEEWSYILTLPHLDFCSIISHLWCTHLRPQFNCEFLDSGEYISSPEPSTRPDIMKELNVCLLTKWVQKWWQSGSEKEQRSQQMSEYLHQYLSAEYVKIPLIGEQMNKWLNKWEKEAST